MKRKIAAILAADVVGYSKLVAEDEEETLRRLASYRSVFDDFIARGSGRVFNTAGDAILAEFPSAVEAVRCAIDVQESLRTRNLAYPPSRQMYFRIGITIGDVVERDGDLLGDGVNIAARLEGLAKPGGLCVSRTVYEQVSNKMSVQFADIGEQQVKNIPSPVHAYTLTLGSDAGGAPAPAAPTRKLTAPATPKLMADRDCCGERRRDCDCRDRLFPSGASRHAADECRLHADRPHGRRGRTKIAAASGPTSRAAGAGNHPIHHRSRTRGHSIGLPAGSGTQSVGHQHSSGRIHVRSEGR
jgi:class 3 adenylate cyclase